MFPSGQLGVGEGRGTLPFLRVEYGADFLR